MVRVFSRLWKRPVRVSAIPPRLNDRFVLLLAIRGEVEDAVARRSWEGGRSSPPRSWIVCSRPTGAPSPRAVARIETAPANAVLR